MYVYNNIVKYDVCNHSLGRSVVRNNGNVVEFDSAWRVATLI